MLDKIDLGLISLLEDNGRASYAQIARSLAISPITAAKRLESLLNNDILTVNAVPNPYKLGYHAHSIIEMNVPVNKIEEVCNRLKNNFFVNLITPTFGHFNLLISVYFPSWDRLHSFVSSELAFKVDISEIGIFFVNKIMKRYRGFEPDKADSSPITTEIDEIDQKMIEELTLDGRATCLRLANTLGISLSSVSKRLNRLTKENIIRIQALTNPTKIGYRADAFIFIKAEHDKIESICQEFQHYPEVVSVMTLNNGYDIYLATVARDSVALYEMIKRKIAPTSGITHMETLIRGPIIKRYYGAIHLDSSMVRKIETEDQ
jgi:DNA-binding Lrp family transcriptional regulator